MCEDPENKTKKNNTQNYLIHSQYMYPSEDCSDPVTFLLVDIQGLPFTCKTCLLSEPCIW